MPPTPEEENHYRNSLMHRSIGPQGGSTQGGGTQSDPIESEQRMERQREEDGYLPGMGGEIWFSGMGDGGGLPRGRRRGDIPVTPYNPPEPHNYVDGINWEPFSENMDRDHPIELNGEHDKNINETFIRKATPLFNAMRKRPLPYEYHFVQEEAHDNGHTDGRALHLLHKGIPVLTARWNTKNGHTYWLGPVENSSQPNEHRHMTLKLLQEAWDISRRKGEYGPAASDNLSTFSGKILKKYNPFAEEYRASDYAYEYDNRNWDQETAEEYDHYPHEEGTDFEEEDEDARYEEALGNHEYRHGRPCEACGGTGKSVLTAATSWNYAAQQRVPNGSWHESAVKEEEGEDDNGNSVTLNFYHPYYMTRPSDVNDRPEAHGYKPVVRRWGEVPNWEKPCEECSHLPHPGFPAHEDNDEYHEQVERARRNQ